MFKINIISSVSSLTTSSCDMPFKILLGILDTGHRRFEAYSRSARLQGLLEVDPARILVAMLGDLGVSTLRSIKTMTQFSSRLSIKPVMLPAS
jgi:hypothetical protein